MELSQKMLKYNKEAQAAQFRSKINSHELINHTECTPRKRGIAGLKELWKAIETNFSKSASCETG